MSSTAFFCLFFLTLESDVFIKTHKRMHRAASLLPFLSALDSRASLSLFVQFFSSSFVSFISPPPAELTVLDVLGGERAIDDSRNAF